MFEGSVTSSRSRPLRCMARLVFSMRRAYSLRSNRGRGVIMLSVTPRGRWASVFANGGWSGLGSGLDQGAGAGGAAALEGGGGDRRVLDAGAGQVGDRDRGRGLAARLQPGDHLA